MEAIATTLIQRARAHAVDLYKDPNAVLKFAYDGPAIEDFVTPMFLTGLAGVGKSGLPPPSCTGLKFVKSVNAGSSVAKRH